MGGFISYHRKRRLRFELVELCSVKIVPMKDRTDEGVLDIEEVGDHLDEHEFLPDRVEFDREEKNGRDMSP